MTEENMPIQPSTGRSFLILRPSPPLPNRDQEGRANPNQDHAARFRCGVDCGGQANELVGGVREVAPISYGEINSLSGEQRFCKIDRLLQEIRKSSGTENSRAVNDDVYVRPL